VTGSVKPVLSPMTGSLIFCLKHKDTSIHYQVYCQNEEVLGGLLLLAAFSQPIGDPYERSGSIMELWWEGRGLSVTVKLHGAE